MIAHAHWARGAFDQLGPGPLRQFARVREQVPNALGGGEEDVAHTFSTAGSYNVTFTYDPGYEDACYNPYADGASGSLPITVTP